MSKCRACLKSRRKMISLDKKYVFYFNILTDLNISTDMPQQLCKCCHKTLQLFIQFRDKCIAVNSVFDDINFQESIKEENVKDIVKPIIKQELGEDSYNYEDDNTNSYGELVAEYNIENNLAYNLILKTESKEGKNHGSHKKVIKVAKAEDQNKTYLSKKNRINNAVEIGQAKLQRKAVGKTSKTNLPCGLCPKSFESITQLELHLLIHKDYKSCSICLEKFLDWQELISHRIKHLPGKQHSCHLCPKRFRTPLYLEYHYRTCHSEGEKHTLRCKICNRVYNTPKKLRGHINACHNTVNKYICDRCNKLFSNKNMLKVHVAGHMVNKPYTCDLCDYASRYSSNLKVHRMYKHKLSRSLHCPKCRKAFITQAGIDNHKCKPDVMCSVCGKIFRTTNLLNRHLAMHEEVGRYKCERCPATFKSKACYDVHQNKHDGIRKYECEYCAAKFYFGSVLIKHRRTHTGIKPYVCKVCQKAFTGNHNLKVHMRVHGEYNLIVKKLQNDEQTT